MSRFIFNGLLFKLTEPNAEYSDYFGFTKEGKIVMTICAILIIALPIIIYNFLIRKKSEEDKELNAKKKTTLSTKELVVCALCIALAVVCSNIKFFEMPYGGSITLFSMFFITYIGYCFGFSTGLFCGLAYGIFQFIQDPWLLSPLQLCFDYVFAFALLGVSGIFRNLKTTDPSTGEKRLTKKGLIIGYVIAAVLRGISHVIGGYLFWMDSMPDNFPKRFSFIYPVVYNFSYIGAEIILTVILLLIPGVAKVLIRLRREANR